MKKHLFILLLVLYHTTAISVTIVYNMRIASITRRQKFETDKNKTLENLLAGTPFIQWRKIRNGSFKQNDYGLLGTYIYNKDNYYIKVDTAFARVNSTIIGEDTTLKVSRTQADDLLFTGGYGHAIGNKWRLAYSGLFGVPLHRNYVLEFSQFGIGHIGLGGQIDSAYDYLGTNRHVLFGAVRFVHFFDRTIKVENPCLIPLYAHQCYNLKPGNLVDLFISHQTTWNKQNRFEFGYDATFAFSASICPAIINFANTAVLIRNSFFGAYSRYIPIHNIPSGIIVALSGGFDSKPKLLGSRYFFTLWGLWGFGF